MNERNIYVPPEYVEDQKKPIIFLGGPIQGTDDWQVNAVGIIHSTNPDIIIASPRRTFKPDDDYNQQVEWEKYHLKQAGDNGVTLFWLAKETNHIPDRAYAQTSRVELGRWMEKHVTLGYRIVIGVEDGFSGAKYIRKTVTDEFSDIPILTSLEETCQTAIELLPK